MGQKVTLVVPIYNEAPHLEAFLQKLDNIDLGLPKELVFVDDCSKDESRAILGRFSFTSECKIIHQPVNGGKGAALRKGIEQATGSIIGIQDADFEYDMADIPQLISPIIEGQCDVVFGSRFKKSASQVHRTFHYLINRFLTIASNALCGLYLTDMETCYKFFRAEIIKNIHLTSDRFGFEPEVTAKIARLNVRVHEYPISYHPRTYIEGKKITWKDGIAAIWHIFYFNVVANKKVFFKRSMDSKLIPGRYQWL
jgi:glycosyltransferase involved in cell wall biosynthesis